MGLSYGGTSEFVTAKGPIRTTKAPASFLESLMTLALTTMRGSTLKSPMTGPSKERMRGNAAGEPGVAR
jgi:hypothetical protein